MSYDIPRMKNDDETKIQPMAPSPTPKMKRPKPPPPLLAPQEPPQGHPNQQQDLVAWNPDEDDAERDWLLWCGEQEKSVQPVQTPPTLQTVPKSTRQNPTPKQIQDDMQEGTSKGAPRTTTTSPTNLARLDPTTTPKSGHNIALSNPLIFEAKFRGA